MSRIAILGWGSLIWDLDDLAPKVSGDWALGAGPVMALEFSRISPKRAHALTVVLDPGGDPRPTAVIASIRADVETAAADLIVRERTHPAGVGWVDLASGRRSARCDIVMADVKDWCAAEGWSGAVWTDLPSNFVEKRGEPFTLDAAVAYLRTLPPAARAEAVRYIENAPPQTDTPLRRRLADEDWWRADAARLS